MKTSKTYYRLAIGVAVATVLFLIWAIGALGIIGDGGRPDRIYLAVFAVLAIGTAVARLRPRGMALALLATGLVQALVTAIALLAGMHDDASVADILGINAMYVALFGVSAWLFRRAAEQRSAVAVSGRD
jgi:predicted membrane protein